MGAGILTAIVLATAVASATLLVVRMAVRVKVANQHWLITGGTSGIGLALAKQVARQGASVTLVARTLARLEAAKEDVENARNAAQANGRVQLHAADVTVYSQVQAALAAAEATLGPVDVLVCNAGSATPGYFHEQDISVFEQHMRLNYLGVLYTIKAAYNGMVQRNSGHICIVTSTVATMGLIGYSAYCPSKYAAKGLADTLRMEGTNVTVSVAMPPDTNTAGFEHENVTKPIETKLISESGNTIFTPDQVAAAMLKGVMRGQFLLPNPDLGIAVHCRIVKGIIPRSFPGVLVDMLLGFVGPIVHWIIASGMDATARKHAKARFGALRSSKAAEVAPAAADTQR